jgi:hypothetical protein
LIDLLPIQLPICYAVLAPGRMHRWGRTLFLGCAVLAGAILLAACDSPMAVAAPAGRQDAVTQVGPQDGVTQDMSEPATADLLTLTGTRLTRGNAVDCPTIRDDAGVVHSVSYLTPGVAIGARVTVSGVYGITTSCRGTVLVVQEESIPPE